MSLIPEETAPGVGFYQQCVQELQRPHPDYAKVRALATLSLVETLQEVACQVGAVAHQITLAKALTDAFGSTRCSIRTNVTPPGVTRSHARNDH